MAGLRVDMELRGCTGLFHGEVELGEALADVEAVVLAADEEGGWGVFGERHVFGDGGVDEGLEGGAGASGRGGGEGSEFATGGEAHDADAGGIDAELGGAGGEEFEGLLGVG